MTNKSYNDYEYIDLNSKYVYPNTNVLLNLHDIKDPGELAQTEHFLVWQRVIELSFAPIIVKSMHDVKRIHAHLFLDLYAWAGEYREVNISKQGKPFMALQSFGTGELYLNSLISDFLENANTRSEIIFHLARILDNLNYMHCFREGNGRTQREAIRSLALNKGYIADINLSTDKEIYHLYMDGVVNSRIDLLEQLFDKILEENE